MLLDIYGVSNCHLLENEELIKLETYMRRGNTMNLLELLEVDTAYEVKLALPNEIFSMLMDEVESGKLKKTHLPFAYSYLYLTTYMYRYGKYQQHMASTQDIKVMLGYDKQDKRINYIIKENGLLEQIGLMETTKDIPVGYTWQDEDGNDREFVKVEYLDDFKETFVMSEEFTNYKKQLGWNSRTTIKRPRFAYVRDLTKDLDDIDCEYDYDGTFYSSKNTHIIDFRVFDFCMQREDLGVTGFYMYSYLKYKNDLHGGYDASRERLASELGLSTATISRYRDALRKYNLIELVHNMETFNSRMKKEEYKAPTNYVNDFEKVVSDGVEYEKFLDSIGCKGDKKQESDEYIDKHSNEIIKFDIADLPY